MRSKLIAISAISASLTSIFLTLGAYIEATDVFAVVIGSIFTILPLYYKSFKASALAYLVGGVIGFLFSGFNLLSLVFPAYFTFFGIYPLIKYKLMDKNFNKIVGFIIGLLWFVAVAYGLYFYYINIMQGILDGIPFNLQNYVIYLVGGIAIVFYVVYDRFIVVVRKVADYYLSKILK